MQLQIGKKYRTRDGSGIALIEKDTNVLYDPFPMEGTWVVKPPILHTEAGACFFRHDGGWDELPETFWKCLDLVEEVA